VIRRQLPLILAVIWIAALFGVHSVIAAPPRALAFAVDHLQIQDIVEQQSPDYFLNDQNPFYCTHDLDGTPHPDTCVHNPTDCGWGPDDSESRTGTGLVTAGSTISTTMCIVWDGSVSSGVNKHIFKAFVNAPSLGLTVTLSDSHGNSWQANPVAMGNGYRWTICHNDQTPGPYPTIPDSNGGYGVIVTYTFTVAGLSKNVRNVNAVAQTGTGIWSIDCTGAMV